MFVCLFVCFVCLFVCFFVCLLVCLFVCLSAYLFVGWFAGWSTRSCRLGANARLQSGKDNADMIIIIAEDRNKTHHRS
jgi:hypothetical protein